LILDLLRVFALRSAFGFMDVTVKILMLEDVEDDAMLVEPALRKEGLKLDKLRVDTRAIQTYNPDIILSDHSLPQVNSMEALKICQGLNCPQRHTVLKIIVDS
jgi:CheY-like chemotaxis protein